jgi:hypothetical protein
MQFKLSTWNECKLFKIIELFIDLFQIPRFSKKKRKGTKSDENGRRN